MWSKEATACVNTPNQLQKSSLSSFTSLLPSPSLSSILSLGRQRQTRVGEASAKHHFSGPSWLLMHFPLPQETEAKLQNGFAAPNTCKALQSKDMAAHECWVIRSLGQGNLVGTQRCYCALHGLFKSCSNLQPACHLEKYIYRERPSQHFMH